MQLVGKGLLKLNDPVESFLPEVKQLKGYSDSAKITFLQLATHTSGLTREPAMESAAEGPIADWEKKVVGSEQIIHYANAREYLHPAADEQ